MIPRLRECPGFSALLVSPPVSLGCLRQWQAAGLKPGAVPHGASQFITENLTAPHSSLPVLWLRSLAGSSKPSPRAATSKDSELDDALPQLFRRWGSAAATVRSRKLHDVPRGCWLRLRGIFGRKRHQELEIEERQSDGREQLFVGGTDAEIDRKRGWAVPALKGHRHAADCTAFPCGFIPLRPHSARHPDP